jgi:multiple sugar transport system substrate-binding protein
MRKTALLVTLLLLAAMALAACGGAAQQAVEEAVGEEVVATAEAVVEEVAPTVEAVVEEVAPTVEAVVEEVVATEEPPAEPAAEETSGEKTQVRWFIGLGTGGNEAQLAAQQAAVDAFNAANPDLELVMEVVQNEVAYDTLSTLIASGDAPDIVGPVGTNGANSFPTNWLDLAPLVESTGYDLSQFPEAAVEFYRTADGGLNGLPFAVFPAMIFYNRDLFDEAGLNYPPHKVGEPYVMPDGTEMPWNFDTLAEVAKLLTVDANGNDATSPDFDPENVVQWGYTDQWIQETRALCNPFGAASLEADGQAVWPESYEECVQWVYKAIWEDRFYPNAAQEASELLATPNVFGSGNVGMAQTHLWFTCCIVGAPVSNWDLAVVPANADGVTTSKLHADTFRVLNTTENPEAAFRVLTYLIGEAAPELSVTYGALPIREGEQADFFAAKDADYPQGVDWAVVNEMLQYPDIPSHENFLPNYQEAVVRMQAHLTLLKTEAGLDLAEVTDTFLADMQAIYDSAE